MQDSLSFSESSRRTHAKPRPYAFKAPTPRNKGKKTQTQSKLKFEKLPKKFLKYKLYETSVQSVGSQVDFFEMAYKDLNRGKKPRILREDFCGTFAISCRWVKNHPERRAIGLDLDPEPLSYGRLFNLSQLNPVDQERITLLKQNVISTTAKKADIVAACNFSFYIFKRRDLMIQYFKQVYKSLAPGGVFLLEAVGGPGMMSVEKERKRHRKNGKPWFTYIWDQQSFDPISGDVFYAIHFKFPDGKIMKNAFTYDWRLWSIPELRECLQEAGFEKTAIYWEQSEDGEGTGYYYRTEEGENDQVWVSYLAGQKP